MNNQHPCVFVLMMVASATASAKGLPPGREPPPQAYEDCRGHQAGDVVQHMTRDGVVAATCVQGTSGLTARPTQPGGNDRTATVKPQRKDVSERDGRKYSLEQAMSDRAQLNTIAFNGLAFLTGDFGFDTFLPPGKVSDYFGFQYLRDIDLHEGGHNTNFLTKIAYNVLNVLNKAQKAQLIGLAKSQQDNIRHFAEMRLPLIKAFRLNLEGKVPAGRSGLDRQAIINYSAELYALDGQLAYDRAQVMADVLRSLTSTQRAVLSHLKLGDSGTWPEVSEPMDRRGMPHDVNVAVMTYASEMFSWYAGSIEADVYFCPERHGMYFGGFGMKTAPAMGKRDYSISTTLTGTSGEAFLAVLNQNQRGSISALISQQRSSLEEIVRVRREIASELRRLLKGEAADGAKVIALSRRYGELDGEISYLYASAFTNVGQSLTSQQRRTLMALRKFDPAEPRGPFVYSTPVSLRNITETDQFFGVVR